MTTAVESFWSRSVCENFNADIGNLANKIVTDTQCSLEGALDWDVSVHNALFKSSGFSQKQ